MPSSSGRPQATPQREPRLQRGPRQGPPLSTIAAGLVFVVMLVGTAGFMFGALNAGPTAKPGQSGLTDNIPTGSPGHGSPGTSGITASLVPGQPTPTPSGPLSSGDPTGSPDPGSSPTPSPPPVVEGALMPIVPVVSFWAVGPGLSRDDLVAALEGHSDRFPNVIVPSLDRDAIASALGVTIAASVTGGTPDQIRALVKGGALGLLRASDVTPAVRALPLDGKDLFGTDHIAKVGEWPLSISIGDVAADGWDQGDAWTLVAAGDIVLDRGTYLKVVKQHKGPTYPFDGGTAQVTGRHCCGWFTDLGKYDIPDFVRTGNSGAVRSLVKGADLTIANLEDPTPDNWIFHPHGLPFSGDPELLPMLSDAGIDFVSLANNHIEDYGTHGIKDTIRHLGESGLATAGAGTDLAAARVPASLTADGHAVTILPCVAVDPSVFAGDHRSGGRACTDPQLVKDIRAAAAQPGVVIVFPHWGTEYVFTPTGLQKALAKRWAGAGADLILGSHPHVAGAVGEFKGTPTFFSMGNFVLDQNWAEITMEGIIVEVTFHGDTVAQAVPHPTLIVDLTQPNLLDPESAATVLDRMKKASKGVADF